jgi:transposase
MMGQLPAAQNALFYDFSLEHHIPDDHLLRQIDQLLDFDAIRQHLTPHYSHTGRPSIDPELMIRMLLLGYCYGIRSERRLCEEVNFNLAYRWFCRLGLEDAVPDHSTFSKNRHGRFRDSDLLRYVFNTVVTRCVEEGLVGGEGFAIDASLVRADANKQRREDSPVDWTPSKVQSRAVKEYLEMLDQDDALNRKQKCVEGAKWLTMRRWLEANHGDELAKQVRAKLASEPGRYAAYTREYLGWGVFALMPR